MRFSSRVIKNVEDRAFHSLVSRAVVRRSGRAAILSGLVLLVGTWGCGVGAAQPADPTHGQWLSYGRDDSQQRYAPSAAIDTQSVARLGLKWTVDLPNESALVSTPLMVDDTLYFTGKFSVVYAVSARTAQIKWTFDPKSREELAKSVRRMTYNWGTSRGVASWKDSIIVAAVDGRLISLSAKTGRPRWTTQTLDPTVSYTYISGAPLVFGDKVLIGNSGGDFGPTRGFVTAYSAETGRQLWRFYTVPGDPAKGFENKAMAMAAKTWGADGWKSTGGGNVWNALTFDRELNRIYIGTGNGSPWNQQVRGRAGGDNLFVASIVALDADTGQYQWHYQTAPGDNWDFDAVQDMILTDLMVDGSRKKVLLQANKNGFFYVIDRTTGKLISADKFAHVTWAERIDLKTGRPVEAANMRPVGPSSSVITFWPWVNGAHNWPSMSFNPDTGLVYIPGMDMRQTFDARGIAPESYKADRVEQWIGFSDIVGRDQGALSAASKSDKFEQSAWLQARDPRTNKAVWQVRQPGLWAGGTLTTAGDLVFIGQADGNLAAYHAKTGALLWKFDCGRPISASPISYELDGVQYIAALAGWGGMPAVEGALTDPAYRMRYREGGRGLFVFALGGEAQVKRLPFVAVTPIDVPGFVPQDEKVRLGQHLFDNNCNLCHGTDALSGGSAPDLRASPVAADEDALKTIVLKGALLPLGMPHYVDFSNEDVDAIYHYLRFTARKDLACAAAGARVDSSSEMSGCASSLTPN